MGRKSLCEAFGKLIEEKLAQGLSAQRIYQDLKIEVQFTGSYQAVKRFVRSLRKTDPQRVWRIEVAPGEEAQVDFGAGVSIVGADGRKRKTWIFRVVLSFSRKGYSEAVFHQDTETFLRCLENAFRHFGGVTKTVNLDNLKAAVLNFNFADPELNPKLREFARHCGTVVLPCLPKTPEHKGKVENSVGSAPGAQRGCLGSGIGSPWPPGPGRWLGEKRPFPATRLSRKIEKTQRQGRAAAGDEHGEQPGESARRSE